MALLSLSVVDLAAIFVIAVLADDIAERSAVAFSSTSIAVAIARLLPFQVGKSIRNSVEFRN